MGAEIIAAMHRRPESLGSDYKWDEDYLEKFKEKEREVLIAGDLKEQILLKLGISSSQLSRLLYNNPKVKEQVARHRGMKPGYGKHLPLMDLLRKVLDNFELEWLWENADLLD